MDLDIGALSVRIFSPNTRQFLQRTKPCRCSHAHLSWIVSKALLGSELARLGRRHFPDAPRTKQASLDSLSATESVAVTNTAVTSPPSTLLDNWPSKTLSTKDGQRQGEKGGEKEKGNEGGQCPQSQIKALSLPSASAFEAPARIERRLTLQLSLSVIVQEYSHVCAHGIVFSKAVQVLSDSAPPDTELLNLISPNQLSFNGLAARTSGSYPFNVDGYGTSSIKNATKTDYHTMEWATVLICPTLMRMGHRARANCISESGRDGRKGGRERQREETDSQDLDEPWEKRGLAEEKQDMSQDIPL
ncbi:hypothetical protein NQZ68_026639 [Dissostichus eleginoides]|nr:hypothetical protein NQZ68_026639 [Dissostichus eleginoides]